uniref:Acyl-CoA thioesterase 8 n=1 Tax=Nothobranchius furzeri TaxID=105023 RepID=A0A8C6LQ51_NOTFU
FFTPRPGEDSSSQSSDAPYPQDLRSVLVTSVLNLEELDVDLYRGPEGSGAVPGGPHKRWPQFHCSLCESHPARTAHINLPGVLPGAADEPPAAPVHHASGPSA